MTSFSGKYIGNKRVEITHDQSGAVITTSAPKDNNGDGLLFSPTDITAASLGACIVTTMAIVADRNQISLEGVYFKSEKVMTTAPRRIAKIPLEIHLPKTLSEDNRKRMENTAKTCPVHHSLHPEIEIQIQFVYDI